jgi:hypothetical protein
MEQPRDVHLLFPGYAACSIEKALDNSYINESNISKNALTELAQKSTLNSNKIPNNLRISESIRKDYTKEERAKYKYMCPSPQHVGDKRVSKLQRVHVGISRSNIIKKVLQKKIPEELAEKISMCFMCGDGFPTFDEILSIILRPAVQNVLKSHGNFSVMFACPNCNHTCDNDRHPGKNFIAVKIP